MFNKFLGKKDSPQKDGSKQNSPKSINTSSQGAFLCPVCFEAFENSDILTKHYSTLHDSSSNNQAESAQSTSSFNPQVENILKKYGSTSDTDSIHETRSISSFTEPANKDKFDSELNVWKEQLAMSEETRVSLTENLLQFQKENNKLSTKLRQLNSEKQSTEEKYQSISKELKELKNKNEQLQTENELIKLNLLQVQEEYVKKTQQIGGLEIELTLRPSQDDLDLLKKELVQVQQLNDTLLSVKEKDYDKLMRDFNQIKTNLEQKENENKELKEKLTNSEELDNLNAKLAAKERDSNEKENKLAQLQENLTSHSRLIEQKEDDLTRLKLELDEKNTRIICFVDEIKELNQINTQLSQNVNELEQKKIELTTRLHAQQLSDPTNVNNETNREEEESGDDLKKNQFFDLIKEKETLENELISLRSKNQSINDEKLEWLNEKKELQSNVSNLNKNNSDLKSLTKRLETEQAKLNSEKTELDNKVNNLNRELETSLESNRILINDKKDLNELIKSLDAKSNELNSSITKLCQEKEVLENDKQLLIDQLSVSNRKIEDLSSSLRSLNDSIFKLKEEISNLNSNNEHLRRENSNLITKLEIDSEVYNQERDEFKNQLNSYESREKELKDHIKDLDEKYKKENQAKVQLTNECFELSKKNQDLFDNEQSLKSDLERLNKEHDELKSTKETLSNSLEILRNENSIMQSTLVSLKKNENELSATIERLNEELKQLAIENEEIKIERDDCDRMRIDIMNKNELQLQALNLNLANLRGELKQHSEKLIQSELIINTIKGDNLEMEARLSNSLDERNELLDRCIKSEKLCEQLRVQNIELKRRLEDTQQALHELGMEHQTLQVQNYKKANYKWVDDSLVSDCTQCKKAFTVTNRKHHCRNCGNVFCHECSDQTAIISSNKKPQRVCKICYIEINN